MSAGGTASAVGEMGHVATLQVLLTTVCADLRADLGGEAFNAKRLGPELEVAHELQQLLLPRPEGKRSVVGSGAQADARVEGGRENLLERLSHLGGARRPLPALARELEAAEQYCRVLDRTAPLPNCSRGVEPRTPSGGRDLSGSASRVAAALRVAGDFSALRHLAL